MINKLFFVACLSLAFQPAYSAQRIGNLEVRINEGTPCFYLPASEFHRANGKIRWHGFSVFSEAIKTNWRYYIPKGEALALGHCLGYGEIPAAAIDGDGKKPTAAPPLQSGVPYNFIFDGRPENEDWSFAKTSFYDLSVCFNGPESSLVAYKTKNYGASCSDEPYIPESEQKNWFHKLFD